MGGTADTTGRGLPAWPKDALRISFGIIWLVDAVLKWLPGFRSSYMGVIMGQADGQPGWLKPWFDFWINLQHPRVSSFAYLVIWATAEGFGGPYTSGSSDIGTAVIYAAVFMGLLA